MNQSGKGVFSVFKQDVGSISRHTPSYCRWTEAEDKLLLEAVDLYGSHKWSLIASHVPNRTPVQCSTRWLGALNTHVQKGRWSKEEDDILTASVDKYLSKKSSQQDTLSWSKIAQKIPNRTGIQCQARWTEALDPSVRKGRWKKDEDDKLQSAVKKFGCCWIRVAESIPGRTQRQSRTRWNQIQSKIHKKLKPSPPSCQKKKPTKKLKELCQNTTDHEAIETLSASPIRLGVPYILLSQKMSIEPTKSITIPHDIISPLASPTSTLSSYDTFHTTTTTTIHKENDEEEEEEEEEDDDYCTSPDSFSSFSQITDTVSPLSAMDATRILDDLDLSYSSFIHDHDSIPNLFSTQYHPSMNQFDFSLFDLQHNSLSLS